MADIKSDAIGNGDVAKWEPSEQNVLSNEGHIAFVELLFFAYRDFTSGPDAILQNYGFGRAHHRVLHFVHRNPGLRVAELLEILNITKQSLGRVLKKLIDDGYIKQQMGVQDRRQRLLYVTKKGSELALELAMQQSRHIQAALKCAGAGSDKAVSTFLLNMIAPQNRAGVLALIEACRPASDQAGKTDKDLTHHAKCSNT